MMPARMLRPPLPLAAALALAACNVNVVDPFPKEVGYQPLETSSAPWPSPVAGDGYPEVASLVSGRGSGHFYAHARAYVKAPLADVWTAMQYPDVCALVLPDASDYYYVDLGVEPEFPVSFRIRYVVHDLITVQWDLTYREGPLETAGGVPTGVGMRYQKTWGTGYIQLQSGSAVAYEVAPGVTGVEIVGHLEASSGNPDPSTDVVGTVQDFYSKLLARVRAPFPP